jgi:hypothetical protein
VINGQVRSAVVQVHLTWIGKREREGYPRRTQYRDMFEWLKDEVIPDTRDWMSEEDLEDIVEENA